MKILATIAALAAATMLSPAAHADANQDREFYRLLTQPDQDHPVVVYDFQIVRAQGIAACEREDRGEPPHLTVKAFEPPTGPYTYDDAVSIVTSAEVVYCPSHTDASLPGGGRMMSTPISPPPVYPALMWMPNSMNYAR